MFRIAEEKDIGYGPGHFSPSASQLEYYSEAMRKRIYKKMQESIYASGVINSWDYYEED